MHNLKKYILLFFILNLVKPALGTGIDTDPFAINNIEMYFEDKSPEDAKINADDAALARAFEQLLERLLPKSSMQKLLSIKTADYAMCLSDSTQLNERVTSQSYYAVYNIKFERSCIRKLLNRKGIYYTENYAPMTIIIPLLEKDKKLMIWLDDDWKNAFDLLPDQVGLSKFIYLMGDIIDLSILSEEGQATISNKAMMQLLKRYGGDNITTVIVRPTKPEWHIEVTNNSISGEPLKVFSGGFKPDMKGTTVANQYHEALIFSLNKIDAYYKRSDLLN